MYEKEYGMKVLFVTYCRAVLGANLSLLNLICDLKERYDVEAHVLIPSVEDGDFHLVLEKEDIPYHIHEMKSWVVPENKRLKWARGFKTYLHNKREIKMWKEILEKQNFDVIYSNNSTIQYGADLAEVLNLPHIWHVREYLKEGYKITFNYPLYFVKKKFKQSKSIITVSRALKEYFESNIYCGDNIVVIHNGIKCKKKMKTNWNYDNKLQICNVGALQEGKNQLELLQAAEELIKQGIVNFHISFIGSGEEYEGKLKEFCENKNLQEYVSFMGYQSNVSDILDSMDVGTICSKNEAFGRVTVEYMLASLGVIGAEGAGTSEIIENGRTGYLYASGNIGEFADCIRRFIDNRNKLEEIGINAYMDAKEKFMLEMNTDAIYEILKNA